MMVAISKIKRKSNQANKAKRLVHKVSFSKRTILNDLDYQPNVKAFNSVLIDKIKNDESIMKIIEHLNYISNNITLVSTLIYSIMRY